MKRADLIDSLHHQGLVPCLRLGPGDAEDAGRLSATAYWNEGMTAAELTEAVRHSSAWVGVRDRDGRLIATSRAISDHVKWAWIYDVLVEPAWRGKGVGDAVVRLLLDDEAVRRCLFVCLSTKDAAPFYERMGFVVRGGPKAPKKPWVSVEMGLYRRALPYMASPNLAATSPNLAAPPAVPAP